MWIILTLLSTHVLAESITGSALQDAMQEMLTQLAADLRTKTGTDVALSLGWKSAVETFNVAAGSVTNPGETRRAVTTKDTFNYGSSTKAVVAAAVMRMVDSGKVKLNHKVNQYVNPFLKRNNGTTMEELFGSNVSDATVLQIIRMEAGIPDYEFRKDRKDSIDSRALESKGEEFPPYAWMRSAADQPLVCAPGTCATYSSTSYEVAGLLLAALQHPDGDYGDLDFGAAAFPDASMYPSMKLPAGTGQLKDTMSVAGLVSKSFTHPAATVYKQNPTIMGWACGGLNANTKDLASFFYDLLDESAPNPIVSAASRAEMENIKMMQGGYFHIAYGAGLMTDSLSLNRTSPARGPEDWGYLIGHEGSTFGFHAKSGYMPKAKAALSAVTNADSGYADHIAACKATEVAAKVLAGETLYLDCDRYLASEAVGTREVMV